MRTVDVGHPHRFRTLEDATKWMVSDPPDLSLPIPTFIEYEDGKIRINPEYENAPYEQSIVVLDPGIGVTYKGLQIITRNA